jgi:hypothetical protein
MLLLAIYVIFIEKELWKKFALAIIAFCLLPLVSCDYKLIHMLIPMLMFINSKRSSKLDIIYALIFALLLIPKNYHLFLQIYDGVILDPLLLITLMLLIVIQGSYLHFQSKALTLGAGT